MNKLKLVAKHEFLKLVKSKSYIIMTLVIIFLPVLGGLVVGGIAYVSGMSSSSAIGYVDHSGIIGDVYDTSFFRFDTEELANRALVGKDIMGYYVVPEDYVTSGEIKWYSSEGSLLTESFRVKSESAIRESLVRGMTQDYLPSGVAERVLEPADVKEISLDTSGALAENQGSKESSVLGMGLGMVFIMMVMTPAGYLLTGLVREKENKVMEVLLSSVSPRQLLAGKIIGIGSAGLLQVILVGVGDLVLLVLFGFILSGFMVAGAGAVDTSSLAVGAGVADITGELNLFPQGIGLFLGMGVVYFLLGYLLYTIILTMAGAMCRVSEQASQWQAPLMFLCILPIFALVIWGGNPNNVVMVGMGMFPLTAPLTMIMRLSCSAVPAWELVASIGIMMLTIGVLFAFMPRLVQGDMLIAGRNFSLKRLVGLKGRAR